MLLLDAKSAARLLPDAKSAARPTEPGVARNVCARASRGDIGPCVGDLARWEQLACEVGRPCRALGSIALRFTHRREARCDTRLLRVVLLQVGLMLWRRFGGRTLLGFLRLVVVVRRLW